MLSQLPRYLTYRVDLPLAKLQRVITPTYLFLSSRVLLFFSLTSNSPRFQDDSLWIPLPGSSLAPGLCWHRLCCCKFDLACSRD